jgi:hypothetical protein
MPSRTIGRISYRHFAGPARPVARMLGEGDEIGGFTVLETPATPPGTSHSGVPRIARSSWATS